MVLVLHHVMQQGRRDDVFVKARVVEQARDRCGVPHVGVAGATLPVVCLKGEAVGV